MERRTCFTCLFCHKKIEKRLITLHMCTEKEQYENTINNQKKIIEYQIESLVYSFSQLGNSDSCCSMTVN